MSTTVVLLVALPFDADPDSAVQVPAEIVSLLARHGQPTEHGCYKHGHGPWRLHYQLSGPNRVPDGQALAASLREIGYETEVNISRWTLEAPGGCGRR